MTNKIIGKYRLNRLIGEGGMARVYEAEHVSLGLKAAVKVLAPSLALKGNIKERFRNEARIMASLNHSNIAKVIDYVEEGNTYAIIMELLEGESLSGIIKQKGALSRELAFDLMVKILKAFSYAHNRGLIHRDVKPSNIFITEDKNIKILDFGIAKMLDTDSELTATGMIMGTPMYMSPEQVKDTKHIDQRSDIYSLGVMMYYMLTGKPPYHSSYEITYKIVTEPLPKLSVSNALNTVIQKATEKEPENRFLSCDAFLSALQETTKLSPEPIDEGNEENQGDEEEKLWNKAKLMDDYKRYKKYLEKYPEGKYANEARKAIVDRKIGILLGVLLVLGLLLFIILKISALKG